MELLIVRHARDKKKRKSHARKKMMQRAFLAYLSSLS